MTSQMFALVQSGGLLAPRPATAKVNNQGIPLDPKLIVVIGAPADSTNPLTKVQAFLRNVAHPAAFGQRSITVSNVEEFEKLVGQIPSEWRKF